MLKCTKKFKNVKLLKQWDAKFYKLLKILVKNCFFIVIYCFDQYKIRFIFLNRVFFNVFNQVQFYYYIVGTGVA